MSRLAGRGTHSTRPSLALFFCLWRWLSVGECRAGGGRGRGGERAPKVAQPLVSSASRCARRRRHLTSPHLSFQDRRWRRQKGSLSGRPPLARARNPPVHQPTTHPPRVHPPFLYTGLPKYTRSPFCLLPLLRRPGRSMAGEALLACLAFLPCIPSALHHTTPLVAQRRAAQPRLNPGPLASPGSPIPHWAAAPRESAPWLPGRLVHWSFNQKPSPPVTFLPCAGLVPGLFPHPATLPLNPVAPRALNSPHAPPPLVIQGPPAARVKRQRGK
ncbi:hypothetical protein CDD83_4140 [Cordyceps sp. RAO-2017]|nr:hypothetical protein CDD83_4140 [Cordyceps sp. RAO-2017]